MLFLLDNVFDDIFIRVKKSYWYRGWFIYFMALVVINPPFCWWIFFFGKSMINLCSQGCMHMHVYLRYFIEFFFNQENHNLKLFKCLFSTHGGGN